MRLYTRTAESYKYRKTPHAQITQRVPLSPTSSTCVRSESRAGTHSLSNYTDGDLRLRLAAFAAPRPEVQRVRAALPGPLRQAKHLLVVEVLPDVQLERDDERLRRALRLQARLDRGRHGVVCVYPMLLRQSEVRRELPDVRRGQVYNLRVPLDL